MRVNDLSGSPEYYWLKLTQSIFLLGLLSNSMLAEGSSFHHMDMLDPVRGEDNQWWLPRFLKEASGIAVVDANSILVHDDEVAVIYRLSLLDGSIETLGWLGSPEFEQDFEGIALDESRVHLVTSDGLIYSANVDLEARNQELEFEVYDTGLESICELEGLRYVEDKLLLPCKVPKHKDYKNDLVVFEFDTDSRRVGKRLVLPEEKFEGIEGPHATAIEVTKKNYFLISGNHLLRVDKKTLSMEVFLLAKKRHYQPEGLGLMKDGSIVIVDDFRKGRSRITYYPEIDVLEKLD